MIVRDLGLVDYQSAWQQMRDFTDARTDTTPDEIWLLQHPPVFTQGQAGKAEHLLNPGDIPVIQTDRGGQVTYHGPGQLVAYTLIDIERAGLNTRQLVQKLEQALIALLAEYKITAHTKSGAPGVYVNDAKIASIGLRVRNGCSYHGLALNIDMDLEPFGRINPCGYAGMAVTQLNDLLDVPVTLDAVKQKLAGIIASS
ncbi:MAG: lipoyl(octanoyl) transferase LipB [Gammaproteobacteria bacterium]|nr:lipoyl(octanoyl) transferase LipB [Gammaproteobacteria bacterium]